jgi:hypothetical protein
MSEHRYRARAIRGDYIRAGAGLALVAVPLAAAPLGPVAGSILGAAGLLFAGFGGRTWLRHKSRYRVDERGIARDGPFGTMLPWSALAGLRLRYYSTRRDRTGGWMQMTLKGDGATMRIDSTLEGFRDVARAALDAAGAAGIALDAATLENAGALGLRQEARPA